MKTGAAGAIMNMFCSRQKDFWLAVENSLFIVGGVITCTIVLGLAIGGIDKPIFSRSWHGSRSFDFSILYYACSQCSALDQYDP